MKFGETFKEYLQGDQEKFLENCSHVEYKRLKKVLKKCQRCRAVQGSCENELNEDENSVPLHSSPYESCSFCDQIFFSELTKEASEIAGFFRSRVRQIVRLHDSSGLRSYMRCLQHCFAGEQLNKVQVGKTLIDYVTVNAIAIRKILKKYDKIHSSVNGRNFNMKMRTEHLELLHSPWLIELGAFYTNFCGSELGEPGEFFQQFYCDLSETQSVLALALSDNVKFEYSLTCAICLDTVFHPYALGCGHLFCKGCACSAASVRLFEGLKSAPPEAKCPVCREVGVYANAVHMSELAFLLKSRRPDYWKERKEAERVEMVKQSKEYWESQTKFALGY